MRHSLDRRPSESTQDYILRLLVDPMTEGMVDEIAMLAKVSPSKVREIRGDDQIWQTADLVASDVSWPSELPRHELVVAALTHYALSACGAGRCSHEACARRRSGATGSVGATSTRLVHDTDRQRAHGASNHLSPARDPEEQSRGALGPRNPGGT
jgi:hypothetical protein